MDFDPDRFAYRSFPARCFATSGNAYDACQTDETHCKGAILLIASERIIGLADTWPFAITEAHGALHQIAAAKFSSLDGLVEAFGIWVAAFEDATALARALGFVLDPALVDILDKSTT